MPAPIVFVSGGQLGDFFHQLSVVKEAYMTTGRKGILYIDDRGGSRWFARGVRATYDDIYSLIAKEPYIEAFQIYQGQRYDHDLSDWTQVPNLYTRSWRETFSKYGYGWNSSAYIHVDPMPGYEDVTFVSTSHRWNNRIDYSILLAHIHNPMFLAVTKETYDDFVKRTGITSLQLIICADAVSLARTIWGCRLFVGTLSMPLALADAMGKDRVAILPESPDADIAVRSDSRYISVPDDIPRMFKRYA